MLLREHRGLQIAAAFALLAAICACGGRRSSEPAVSDPTVDPAAPSGPVTLPDALMPLTEGGQVQAREPGSATLMATFPNDQFDALRTRVRTWMPAHGWTLVSGSETDSARTAESLEGMGMHEAAELARRSHSFGASYQQSGQTVAVSLDDTSGTLTMSLNWI
jgi:hypothetical protein